MYTIRKLNRLTDCSAI